MATDTTAFYAELLAGGFSLTDRGLMAGANHRLERSYLDKMVDPAAHNNALVNQRYVKALTRNNKLTSFNAISGPVWPG
jgi:hypothetical protein